MSNKENCDNVIKMDITSSSCIGTPGPAINSPMSIMNHHHTIKMDITPSSCTSSPCPAHGSPVVKTFSSRILSSCKKASVLTSAVTPTTSSKSPCSKRKVTYNPFNQNLVIRLENPVFSPNVFTNVVSPSQDSEVFKWTIEDISRINPAEIEDDHHYEEQINEETEHEIQRAIDKYFSNTHIPSPRNCKLPTSWSTLKKALKLGQLHDGINDEGSSSPSYSLPILHSGAGSDVSFQDASTQTSLSLPTDLPDSVNNSLQPYLTQNNTEEVNLSMNSLRRKLFFHHGDESPSPIKLNDKNLTPTLKTQNYCLSTPLLRNRCDDPSVQIYSPIDISPITRISSKRCNTLSVHTPVNDFKFRGPLLQTINKTPNTYLQEDCAQVFESPKITRLNRKRKFSSYINMPLNTLCTCTMNQEGNETTKRSFYEESKMSTDNSVRLSVISQDTGYQTGNTNCFTFGTDKSLNNNDSNMKSSAMDCWKTANKNCLVASTPTK